MNAEYRPMAFSIETPRLSLRLRTAADAEWNLELLGEHEGVDAVILPIEKERERLSAQNAVAREQGIGLLTITLRRGKALGYCGLIIGRRSIDEPEIAYELLRPYRGFGYATEAAEAVMDAAFATGRDTIWATVRPVNLPSFRVLEKLRFGVSHTAMDEKGEIVYLVRRAGPDALRTEIVTR